jgi:O-antigen ligase
MTTIALGVASVVIILFAFKDQKKAIFLFTVLIPFAGYLPALEIKGLNFLTLLVLILFLLSSRFSGRLFPPSPINVALALLFTATIFSWMITSFSPPPRWTAFQELTDIKRWIIFIPIYFIYVNATRDGKNVPAIVWGMICGVGLQTLQVLKEFLFTGHGRLYGSFDNPNEMGAFMAAYLPLIGIFFYQSRLFTQRLFYGGMAFLTLFGLVYSQSRGSYLAFLNSVMVFSFMKSRFLFVSLVTTLVLALTVSYTWLPDVVVNRINFTFEEDTFNENFQGLAGELEGSAGSRIILARGALRVFSQNPIIGNGIGTLQYTMGSYMADLGYNKNRVAHNMYLQILAELGLIGFLPFMYILYMSGRAGYQLYRFGFDAYDRNLGIAFLCCVCAFGISNLFGNRFFRISLTGYYWVMAAMVFNKLNTIRRMQSENSSGSFEREFGGMKELHSEREPVS